MQGLKRGGALAVAALALAVTLEAQVSMKIDPALMQAFAASKDGTAPLLALFNDKADLAQAAKLPLAPGRSKAVLEALRRTADASQAAARSAAAATNQKYTSFWINNTLYAPQGTPALAKILAALPNVVKVIPEPVLKPAALERSASAALLSNEWNIRKIRADQAWPSSAGAGVTVAAIDTGVRYTHSALVNQYRGNLGGSFSHATNWSDPTGVCGAAPCDNSGHGTMVTGVIVGGDGGSNQIGVAPEAKWIACKGCADGATCYASHLTACAQWILDPAGDGSGNYRPDVVNNSWVGPGGDGWLLSLVQSWRAAGVFPVFAGGNSGPGCATAASPGDYLESFAAGSTDQSDVVAASSSRGPSAFGGIKPNVTAPGVNIRSADNFNDTSYYYGSGTSMASPHVAGTVALAWSAQPALRGDIAATAQLLADTAVPIQTVENCGGAAGQVPNNTYGYGRVDALLAATTPGAAPKAADDNYNAVEDTPLTVAAPGVLANDLGNGAALQAVLVSTPAHGSAVLNANGSFTYTPALNYNGADQFTYVARGGGFDSNTAAVRITLAAVNDAPVAVNDAASTTSGAAVTIDALANDTDAEGTALAVAGVTASTGAAVVNANQTITYTPPAGFTGVATLTYTASDGQAPSNPATIAVTVSAAANQPPRANDDAATTRKNTRVTINLTANDADPDGSINPATVQIVAKSVGVTITVNANGTVQYTPRRNYTGADSFTYTVKDNQGATSNVATVRVTVTN